MNFYFYYLKNINKAEYYLKKISLLKKKSDFEFDNYFHARPTKRMCTYIIYNMANSITCTYSLTDRYNISKTTKLMNSKFDV